MDRKLTQLGIPHTYDEVPKTGHNCRTPELWEQTVTWLLKQKRVANPDHVSLTVHTLRHNRSHWVTINQQATPGKQSTADARFDRVSKTLKVTTDNVRRLSVGPKPDAAGVTVQLDADSFSSVDLATARHFARDKNGAWQKTEAASAASEKRHGLSGPF